MTCDAYHAIIGLPGSGKTTFLAALWHLINAGEVSTQLVLDRLEGDHRHLNAISDAWQRCEEVPRTSIAAETDISIWIHEPETGHRAKLAFPDLSGESFANQVAIRSCKKAYIDGFGGDGGVMLFITADRSTDGITLLDMASMITGEELETNALVEWTPAIVPQQVKLIELLQFLQSPPFRRVQRRLAVIVSAWDVVNEPQLSPEAWLLRELPMLHQFLQSNHSSFDFQAYGISAQGGNVKSEDRDWLLRKTPSERVICVSNDANNHDLTAPIRWLMMRS